VFGARLRLATLAIGALADEAPRTPTAGRSGVRDSVARLSAHAAAVIAARGEDRPMGVEGRAWDARLAAEESRLEWLLGGPVVLDDLIERWRTTAELFTARSRAHLATVLRAAGRGEDANAEATRARELAGRLGARPVLEELGSLGHATGRSATDDGTLTPREREILALVAQGRSNGEIGTQLFISAKTVSVHVSNVMAKLGAGSRTEAAALGRRRGLVD
jgi:DNA-binding CsgD family transcriptional regulator